MQTITSKEMFEAEVANGKSIVVFSADWCPDCRFIQPFLPEIEKECPSYRFYYVDRDELTDLCVDLDIFGIPSFVAYENGKELDRYVDRARKTKEQIVQFIEQL